MDSISDERLFWAVHKAAAAIMSDEGASSASEYVERLRVIHSPASHKPDPQAEEIALRAIGAIPQ